MVVYRNGFTYAANIFVLGLSLVLFMVIPSEKMSLTNQFRVLAVVCTILGVSTTVFYTLTVKERLLAE